MKMVTFTRAMHPHNAGDQRLVPPEVARELVASGHVAPDPQDFPPVQVIEPFRDDRQTYRTKKAPR